MKLDRRALLGALGLSVAAGTAGAQEAAQPPATPQTATAQPSLVDRITQRAIENRHRLLFEGGRFSGPAYDLGE